MIPVKSSISSLKGYQPNELPYRVKLDANESYNFLFKDGIKIEDLNAHIYPDSTAKDLRIEIGHYINQNPNHIIAGNGSSEMIELILKTYVDKDEKVLSFEPSFSMYQIYSQIYSAQFIGVPSNPDFSLEIDLMIKQQQKENARIIFICSPNNPTGYLIPKSEIIKLLKSTDAIVVVDEAYIEFTDEGNSLVSEIDQYKNLIVIRTLSKAFGLASIRLGYMIACDEIISIINRVKSPYNLNALTQYVGIQALRQKEKMKCFVDGVKERRIKLYQALQNFNLIIYPSYGNFILFKSDMENLFEELASRGILIRKFSGKLEGYYRVTVGTEEENNTFINGLKEVYDESKK